MNALPRPSEKNGDCHRRPTALPVEPATATRRSWLSPFFPRTPGRPTWPTRLHIALLTIALLVVATACSRSDSTIVVGSKNFVENVLLGELIAQQIEARTNIPVDRRLNLGGTFLCHQALEAGEIDIYPEYSGTALIAILKQPLERDPRKVLETVSNAYRERFAAEWMPPFGFNNTFAVVIRSEQAESQNLRTVSDLAAVAGNFVLGFNFEFYERQDGYQGWVETYGLSFKQEPKTMDLGLLYQALESRQIDVAVGNSTDGLIAALNLVVLQDDKRYFPPYDAAAVVRSEALEKHPSLRAALDPLSGLLTEEKMRKLNYEVNAAQRPVAGVVRDLRREHGL